VGLPEIYDLCSKFAHADPEGIFHKYFMDRKGQRLYAHFFDYERTRDDYRRWFTLLLYSFFKIFLIYWNEMLRDKAGQRKKEIELLVREFKSKITALRKRYPLR
jgi:hypothetical protein